MPVVPVCTALPDLAHRATPHLPQGVAAIVVDWQQRHGRHDLPWQRTRDPYRVWLSEIMLQQTQVATALPYYERFTRQFPDVASLAQGDEDEVLALWSGMGYYSRARNLHRCAREVMQRYEGRFPDRASTLMGLPGIGPSTAAAIAAFCFDERVAILDGNVQRVLSRLLAFDADLARVAQLRALWSLATSLLPVEARSSDMPAYTQGLMDLGATVCTSRAPDCIRCPLAPLCKARADGSVSRLPFKSKKPARRSQSLWLLHVVDAQGRVWLERRPDRGIWAGLHALPAFDSLEALHQSLPEDAADRCRELPAFLHVLTHRDLHLHPVVLVCAGRDLLGRIGQWHTAASVSNLGMPAPMRKLVESDIAPVDQVM